MSKGAEFLKAETSMSCKCRFYKKLSVLNCQQMFTREAMIGANFETNRALESIDKMAFPLSDAFLALLR